MAIQQARGRCLRNLVGTNRAVAQLLRAARNVDGQIETKETSSSRGSHPETKVVHNNNELCLHKRRHGALQAGKKLHALLPDLHVASGNLARLRLSGLVRLDVQHGYLCAYTSS